MNSKLPFLALFFLIAPMSSNGQEAQQSKTTTFRVYKIWIDTMDNLLINGYLEALDSIGITVSNKVPYKATERINIPAENIKRIKLRRKGSVLKGAGYGLAAGALVGGGATAFWAEDEQAGLITISKETKIGIGATVWGIIGGGVGAIVGGSSKKMEINGKAAMYYLKIPIIEEMVYGKVQSLK